MPDIRSCEKVIKPVYVILDQNIEDIIGLFFLFKEELIDVLWAERDYLGIVILKHFMGFYKIYHRLGIFPGRFTRVDKYRGRHFRNVNLFLIVVGGLVVDQDD